MKIEWVGGLGWVLLTDKPEGYSACWYCDKEVVEGSQGKYYCPKQHITMCYDCTLSKHKSFNLITKGEEFHEDFCVYVRSKKPSGHAQLIYLLFNGMVVLE